MATQITATLPTLNFPKEVDYPTQEDWAAFSAAAELNFGILGGSWSTQMQLWKTQANAMSSEVNNSADIAQSIANYQGDWTSKGYTLGQSVSVSGIYYICKLTHLTGQNPTDVSSLYWNLALGNWSLKADKTEVALKINKDISPYSSKPTPIDSDLIPLSDSAASFEIKKLTWANIKATIISSFGVMISTLTAKTIPVDADIFTIGDSAATNASKKLTWANIKATLDATWVLNDTRAKTALNASGTAPIYACRTWVNFNGTGTVAIRGSGNVSSITDNGVGQYTVNFTTNMTDVNYSAVLGGVLTDGTTATLVNNRAMFNSFNLATTSLKVSCLSLSGGNLIFDDSVIVNVSVFR